MWKKAPETAKEHVNLVADAAEHAQFIPPKVYVACLNVLTEDRLLTLRP